MKSLLFRSCLLLGMCFLALSAPTPTTARATCGPFCWSGPGECNLDFIAEWCPFLCGHMFTNGACGEGGGSCEAPDIWLMCLTPGGT
jgi:hypothetical protein